MSTELCSVTPQKTVISHFLLSICILHISNTLDSCDFRTYVTICNQLNMCLGSCNQKLAATFSELEVTQDKLNDMSMKLQDTVNTCAEKEHLIEKHVHTERTLTTRAECLLAMADMASSDTGKLHDRLVRKR